MNAASLHEPDDGGSLTLVLTLARSAPLTARCFSPPYWSTAPRPSSIACRPMTVRLDVLVMAAVSKKSLHPAASSCSAVLIAAVWRDWLPGTIPTREAFSRKGPTEEGTSALSIQK